MEVALISKVFRFSSHLVDRVQRQGIRHLPAFLYGRISAAVTERRYGIHTNGWIGSGSITPDPDCLDYDPLDYQTIQTAMASLDYESRRQVLLDYGCGKGRILAVASRYPFQRILGIELSRYLCGLAEENLAAMRLPKLCNEVCVINGDAREYEVPSDVTAIILYNPFVGEVLGAVKDNIEASLLCSPRKLTVLHIHFRDVPSPFSACALLAKKGELPLIFREKMVFEVFESLPLKAA